MHEARQPDVGQDWFTVDRNYKIVNASHTYRAVHQRRGLILWDTFPGSRDVYEAVYEKCWAEGSVDQVVFGAGHLVRVIGTVASENEMLIEWETLAEIDVTTLASLQLSLAQIQCLLEIQVGARSGPSAAPTLRIVQTEP